MSKPIQLATNKHRILLGKEATRIQVDLDLQVQSSITIKAIITTTTNTNRIMYRWSNGVYRLAIQNLTDQLVQTLGKVRQKQVNRHRNKIIRSIYLSQAGSMEQQ